MPSSPTTQEDAPAPSRPSAGYGHLPLLEAAAAKRKDLDRHWPTAREVDNAPELRKRGEILGVYMTDPAAHFRFPTWQFRPGGKPIPQVREILAILREKGQFLDVQGRTTGWDEVAWFRGGHALLDDKAPLDLLATDPDRVVAAARAEFG